MTKSCKGLSFTKFSAGFGTDMNKYGIDSQHRHSGAQKPPQNLASAVTVKGLTAEARFEGFLRP